jgi:hypothetical protein
VPSLRLGRVGYARQATMLSYTGWTMRVPELVTAPPYACTATPYRLPFYTALPDCPPKVSMS